MKKLILICVFTFLFSSHAFADFYFSAKAGYSLINGSYNEPGFSDGNINDSGIKGAFALGGSFNLSIISFRIEFEYDISDKFKTDNIVPVAKEYRGYNINAILDSQRHTFSTNIYLDFNVIPVIKPYIGVGIGYTLMDNNVTVKGTIPKYSENGYYSVNDTTYIDSTDSFFGSGISANFILGIGIKLHRHIIVDIGYKLHYYNDISGDNSSSKYNGTYQYNILFNDIYAGIRFTF